MAIASIGITVSGSIASSGNEGGRLEMINWQWLNQTNFIFKINFKNRNSNVYYTRKNILVWSNGSVRLYSISLPIVISQAAMSHLVGFRIVSVCLCYSW